MTSRAMGTALVGLVLAGCHQALAGVQAAPDPAWDRLPYRAAPAEGRTLALTLYADAWALVTDARPLRLVAGEQVVRFAEVAAHAESAGAYLQVPGAVSARRFRYDLTSRDRLLARYHGQTVEIYPQGATAPLHATLLVTDSGPVYRIGDRLYTEPPGRVALPPLEFLATTPTFEWRTSVAAPWSGVATASYVAKELGWQSEYTLVTDRDQTRGDWRQWAELSNHSGADYPRARLTLVAGDVRRERAPLPRAYGGVRAYADAAPEPYASRYVYRLSEPVTLRRDAEERLALRSAEGVQIERTYRVGGTVRFGPVPDATGPQKARIRLTIPHAAGSVLSEPLPRGKVTVYTPTRQGELAIAGEPAIMDTPTGQRVELDLGEAFDVTSERTQTRYRLTASTQEVAYRIALRNQQDVPVVVWVTEELSGDWTVTSSSHPYERLSATQLRFRVSVPARGQTEVTYAATVQRER